MQQSFDSIGSEMAFLRKSRLRLHPAQLPEPGAAVNLTIS
jgi:hypothetical protein